MSRTIVRLFEDRRDALNAARDVEQLGVHPDDVSILSSNHDNWFDGKHTGGDKTDGRETKAGEGAASGATTGAVIGGGAGVLAGLGLLAVPGLGPVVAAGWLASLAAGAVGGAAAGGAVGGLLGALKKEGVSDQDAHVYSEGVKRGGTLLSVRAPEDRIMQVEAALNAHRPADPAVTGSRYREQGWSEFSDR